jgi:hypothetical protein
MKFYLLYIVSLRCKLLVKYALEKIGLHHTSIELGLIKIKEAITDKIKHELKLKLAVSGLELLDDKKVVLEIK